MEHKSFHGIHPCDICKKEYVSLFELIVHKQLHSTFQCEKCKEQFNNEVQLKIHLSCHSDVLVGMRHV